jgi:PilZ domain
MQSARATIDPRAERKNDTALVCHVLTHDLSDGGVGILSPRPISAGQRIELEMLDGRRLFVQTQWMNRTSDGMYAIGCKFIEHDAAT